MLNLILLILGIVLAFWFIGNALGFFLMLLVAAVVGFGAEAILPGRQIPQGWLGATGVGLIGSWLGTLLIGRFGPQLFNVPLVPAFLGAVLLVIVVDLMRKRSPERGARS